MSTISPTYADLGGLDSPRRAPNTRVSRAIDPNPGRICEQHMFDPVSGWCGCGVRDDGNLAEGSPAWRAEIERRMPTTEGTN